jgi:hypothetical protein
VNHGIGAALGTFTGADAGEAAETLVQMIERDAAAGRLGNDDESISFSVAPVPMSIQMDASVIEGGEPVDQWILQPAHTALLMLVGMIATICQQGFTSINGMLVRVQQDGSRVRLGELTIRRFDTL